MINEVDADGSGCIKFPEFLWMMAKKAQYMYQDSKTLATVQVLYMSSSFWLLGVESRVFFSPAEKERTGCKAEQIHKMTTVFTQNGPRLLF